MGVWRGAGLRTEHFVGHVTGHHDDEKHRGHQPEGRRGKATTALNLAGALAPRGRRVLALGPVCWR